MRDNLYIIDAVISEFVTNNKISGPWKNSTAYEALTVVVDPDDGSLWQAEQDHTSLPSGSFAEARGIQPYWSSFVPRLGDTEGLAVTPDQFGADPEFPATNVAVAVQKALDEALTRGVPLQLDRLFIVNASLNADMDLYDTLRIRGNGGLLCNVDLSGDPLINIVATPESVVSVTAIDNTVTRDFSGQGSLTNCAKITAPGHIVTSGRFCRLISNDPIVSGSATFKGEDVYVVEVSGDDIYISARLKGTYTTSPRIALFRANKKVLISEITLLNDWPGIVSGHKKVGIGLEGLVGPVIDNVTFKHISMSGVRTLGCINANIRSPSFARGLGAITSLGITGYGINDIACTSTHVQGPKGYDCRHIYTNNIITSDTNNPWTYGGCNGGTVSNGNAGACSSAAWDTHDLSTGTTFIACRSLGTYQGQDVAYGGFQLRGKGQRIIGCEHSGQGVGVLIDYDGNETLSDLDRHVIEGFGYDGDDYAIRAVPGNASLVYAEISELNARSTAAFGIIRAQGAKLTIRDSKILSLSTDDNRRLFDIRGDTIIDATNNVDVDFSLAVNPTAGLRDSYICAYQGTGNVFNYRGTVKAGTADWDAIKYFGGGGATDISGILNINADKAATSVDGLHSVGAGSVIRRVLEIDRGKTGNSAYTVVNISSGTAVQLAVSGCFAPTIVRAINSTHASATINGVSAGEYIGQKLIIVCLPGSTQDVLLDATPGNLLSLLADITLDPGAGVGLVWTGQTWLGYSATVAAGPGSGVTDHGALTGLLDDDHTQYHTDARALTWINSRTIGVLADVPALGTDKQTLRVDTGTTALVYRMPGWDDPARDVFKLAPATHDADTSGLTDATASIYAMAAAATKVAIRMFAGAAKGIFLEFRAHDFDLLGRIQQSAADLLEFRLYNAAGAVKSYIGSTFQVFGGDSGDRGGSAQVSVIGDLYVSGSILGPSDPGDYTQPYRIGAARIWDDGTSKLRAKYGSDPSSATDGSVLW